LTDLTTNDDDGDEEELPDELNAVLKGLAEKLMADPTQLAELTANAQEVFKHHHDLILTLAKALQPQHRFILIQLWREPHRDREVGDGNTEIASGCMFGSTFGEKPAVQTLRDYLATYDAHNGVPNGEPTN
jgi:hypothetical protein